MISQLFFNLNTNKNGNKKTLPMGTVFDSTDKTPLAEGGEGVIYEQDGQIIKLYKPAVNLKSKQKKIALLIEKSRANLLPKEVVCPKDIVVDKNGGFIGFSMDKADGEEMKKLANRKFVTANNITTKDILTMLVKIQTVMECLHKNNIFIGDLNDRNILFDAQFNIRLIDCDSWTVGDEKCEVAMDLFRDPLLHANDFNAETDTYSFAVLAWKMLTRIHPFGGTMNPDRNIAERMRNGISVIGNPHVTIPRTAKPWRNLSPSLVSALQDIFQNNSRTLSGELSDMLGNLKFCDVDRDYYYGRYSACPLCDNSAKMQAKPLSLGATGGLTLSALLYAGDIKTVIGETSYINVNDEIVDIRSGKKAGYRYGVRYYFTSDGYLIEDFTDEFIIHAEKEYRIEKKYKSRIAVEENHVYFMTRQNSFMDMTVLKMGNSIKPVCKCSNTAYFAVKSGNYCVLNYYDGKLILNVNGNIVEIKYDTDVINHGIHYDDIALKWLLLLENNSGRFTTCVIEGKAVEYRTDRISYHCPLNAPCISGGTIYIPLDGKIRGFSYKKDAFKDFACGIVNDGSMLIKKKNRFVIVNDENIYTLAR